ncbi:MAG: S41 family peptidase [Chloroflexota bacterium]
MRSFSTRMVLAVAVLTITLLGFLAGFGTNWFLFHLQRVQTTQQQEPEPFGVFWEVWHILERDFIGALPDDRQMVYAAVRGVVALLDDPYTSFVEPQPRELERHDLEGRFGGIGAWVEQQGSGIFVLTPMRDRPAAQAGIVDGDILVAVDGLEITPEMTMEEVLSLIRGPVDTRVSITVRRNDPPELLVFEIVRQEFEVPSISWKLLEEDPAIGYIKLDLFTERTAGELEEALGDLQIQGATQLVLDLRDNGGGLLQSAIDVSSQFLADGVVLYEQKRGGEETFYPVTSSGSTVELPLVILVNAGTASASEIVAGAIQDQGRGLLVGERTFGKGSVQLIYDLSDGSSLHVTAARWLTPNRHQIDGLGLTPDIEATLTQQDRATGRDPQLQAAIQALRQQVHSSPAP